MATQLCVNLPVKNLNKTVEFFTQMGFTFNPQFTDENATCMIVSDTIFVMLLVENYFKTFIKKEVSDAGKTTEVILALSVDSKEQVDDLIEKAFKAGALPSNDTIDYGWMYNRSFQDPDGHLWEVFFMDPSGVPQAG